jgi:hypothetical protein
MTQKLGCENKKEEPLTAKDRYTPSPLSPPVDGLGISSLFKAANLNTTRGNLLKMLERGKRLKIRNKKKNWSPYLAFNLQM